MGLDDEATGDVACEGLDQAELMAMIELQLSEVDMLQVRTSKQLLEKT